METKLRDPLDVALGKRLQALREQRGLSMSAVGREIKTTYQQVRKYETGENRISAATLFRLAQLLDIGVSEFFKGMPGQADRLATGPADGVTSAEAFDNTLGRIEDREVRHHLGGLLQALGSRR